jgi:hypothetical protein
VATLDWRWPQLPALRGTCTSQPPPPPPRDTRPLPACLPACPLPQSQKTQLRSQLDVAAKARESARTSMKELRGSLKFTKGAAVAVTRGGGGGAVGG